MLTPSSGESAYSSVSFDRPVLRISKYAAVEPEPPGAAMMRASATVILGGGSPAAPVAVYATRRASAPQEAPNGGATARKKLANGVLCVGRITRIRLLGSIRQRSGRAPCWFPAPAELTGSALWRRGRTPPEPGPSVVAKLRGPRRGG
ncbi:hypothetical protein [Streptomyces mirabilis]|uniref:hypothetical protein n=1 Tax=Streptomyces mirabilis TaxID=68239 RepID=UPI0036AB9792